MISSLRPARRIYQKDEWRPFFCLRPRQIPVGPIESKFYECPYFWVWLEYVETKARDNDGTSPWIYRLTEAQAARLGIKEEERNVCSESPSPAKTTVSPELCMP